MLRVHVASICMAGSACVGLVAPATAWAFDPIQVIAATGTPVPAGGSSTITGVTAAGLGDGGHFAVRITSSDARFSGVYLFGPGGEYLNHTLDSERLPQQWLPTITSISPLGRATVSRRPSTGLSGYNSFFVLHPDGTRTSYGAFGSTVPGTGPRVINLLPIVTPYGHIFETTYDDRPAFGLVGLDPAGIGTELIRAALVQFNLDGSMTPLALDSNQPGSLQSISWPRDVTSDGAVLFTANEFNVSSPTALRIWRSGTFERVLAAGDPHPTRPNSTIQGFSKAHLSDQGDVLVEVFSRSASQGSILEYLWRRNGVWRSLPNQWTLAIPGRSVECEATDFTLLEDATALFHLRFGTVQNGTSVEGSMVARMTYLGVSTVLSYTGQTVRARNGRVGIYQRRHPVAPRSLRDVHTASVNDSTTSWVVTRDTDGELIGLAATGDTFTYQDVTWTITSASNAFSSETAVVFTARATSPGQPETSFVLMTGFSGPTCGDIDFNNNAVFPEDQDVIDFFNVLAGAPCPTLRCDTLDFNRNGTSPEDQDVIDFLTVLAGGSCQ